MSRVIAGLLFSCIAFGQKAPDSPLMRASKSPYALARYIDSHTGFDWAPLWNSLGLAEASLLPCERPGACSTELIAVLDPQQTILVIDTEWNSEVYIRYWGNEKEGWRRGGAYEATIKYYPRRHEITRIGTKPFIRVASTGISGSDVAGEWEAWIDLTLPDFEPMFGFSSQGHQYRSGGITRFITSLAHPSVNGQTQTIDVSLSVHFLGISDRFEVDLGYGHYSAKYERRPKEKTFTLRAVTSGLALSLPMSGKEFDDLTDFDEGPSNETLLVYALDGLKEVASGQNRDAKDWLRSMLNICADTPEKRTLLELLAKP